MDGPTSIWDIEEGIYKLEDRLRDIIETEAQKRKKYWKTNEYGTSEQWNSIKQSNTIRIQEGEDKTELGRMKTNWERNDQNFKNLMKNLNA